MPEDTPPDKTPPGSGDDAVPMDNLSDASTVSPPPQASPPNQIGPYKILEKIGEGGMGVVYVAEQERPLRRRVALKLIKLGMDTKQVLARFESERQALALMDHPAVAKVFDAGTTPDGRPYFAMEYVQGVPLTEYCDRHKLTTRARLELFRKVCDGVQHAHQKAIIHRDLKPSNVLVAIQDEKPMPKIIDFGVAKATAQRLTEQTVYTELGALIGTPEYMSPEQAEMTGQNIDTRTDVYSLGVMLYEMLVGALPFEPKELRSAGFDEIRRKIREDDPPRPSTRVSSLGERSTITAKNRQTDPSRLQSQLRGDLDWITMKALEKDRTRRYGSPAELASDLGRHLGDEPVLASPPSTVYRARKFVRRHRVGVAVTAAGVLVLLAFAVTMTVQTGRTAAERDRANREARLAKASLLVMHGREALESERTRALAYALASLERADSPDGRRLALQALWRGPSAFMPPPREFVWGLDFSPDGRWLAGGEAGGSSRIFLWSADGHTVTELPFSDRDLENPVAYMNEGVKTVRFLPDSGSLFSTGIFGPTVKLWSVPEGQLIRSMDIAVPPSHDDPSVGEIGIWFPPLLDVEAKRMVSASFVAANSSVLFQLWAIDQDEPQLLDRREIEGASLFMSWEAVAALDPTGNRLAYAKGAEIFLVDLAESGRQPERSVGRHDEVLVQLAFHPDGETLATIDQKGEIRLWSLASGGGKPRRSMQSVENSSDLRFDRHGRHLAATSWGIAHVWDLAAPPDADPMVLQQGLLAAFHPAGEWIATSGMDAARIWPLGRSYPRVLRGHTQGVGSIAFGPQGDWVASASLDNTIRVWPLDPASAERHRIVYETQEYGPVQLSPDGENFLVISNMDIVVVPVAGGKERPLAGLLKGPKGGSAFGPHGRLAAVAGRTGTETAHIRVWDLDSDDVVVLDPGEWTPSVAFTPDGALLSAGSSGDLRLWDLASGTFRVLRQSAVGGFVLSRDGRRLLGIHDGKASLHDLEDGSARELVTHGNQVSAVALHPDGMTAVTASFDGVIRVGPLTGEEPHLLLGHEGVVWAVAVSPDGRWIASAGDDNTVRLWPMPEGRPFHTLPYEEFLDRLRALTNLRVVEDEQGYSVDFSVFPGWESLPTW